MRQDVVDACIVAMRVAEEQNEHGELRRDLYHQPQGVLPSDSRALEKAHKLSEPELYLYLFSFAHIVGLNVEKHGISLKVLPVSVQRRTLVCVVASSLLLGDVRAR